MPTDQPIPAKITELRKAAQQARALADFLREPEAKQGFAELAQKWETEADVLESAKRN